MKKFFITIIAVTGLVACNQDKIVFVDRTKLLEDYQERKDIETKYTTKLDKLKMEADSIGKALDLEGKDLDGKLKGMSQAAAQETIQIYRQKSQFLDQQLQQKGYAINQDGQKEIDSMIKKVNKFVTKYGQDHKYTYILGSNDTGSVMYGEKSKDITAEVLKAINDEYARN